MATAQLTTMLALGLILMVVLYSGTADAIQCYQCTGDCEDPFSNTDAAKCDGVYCSKSKSSVGGIKVTTRGCVATGSAPHNGCKKVSVFGVSSESCYCKGDLCNSATSSKLWTAVLSPVIILTFYNILF